jgi:glycosyl transferase, family 25
VTHETSPTVAGRARQIPESSREIRCTPPAGDATPRGGGLAVLNEFFDRVFVITIERNAERRALLEADLGGVEFTYLFGVDGWLLGEDALCAVYDEELAQKTYGRPLSVGQIGCALSHRMVYEAIVCDGLERVLILEDDARPCTDGVARLPAMLRRLPEDWDLHYLYTFRPDETPWLRAKKRLLYPVMHRFGSDRHAPERIRREYSRRYAPNVRRAGQHWFALAYAVTQATAQRMLEFQMPIRTVADDVTRHMCASPDVNAFLSEPNVFAPRSGLDSTIWNRPPRTVLRQGEERRP